jgi:hypothetical protein
MDLKKISAISLLFFISACADSNDEMIGFYKYRHNLSGSEKIISIKKDGEAYLFVEDVIRNSNALVLTNSDGGLSFKNVQMKLSEDGNTIYFGSINGTRVSANYVTNRKNEIEINKKACAELQKEVDEKSKSMQTAQWNEYVQTLNNRKPENCNIIGAGMRW